MKKTVFVLLFLLPVILFSQNINGRFSSSVYSFERHDSQQSSFNYLRTFQTLRLNANYNKFSLRTRFNLEADAAKKMLNEPRLRFYNLYIEGRNLWDIATIKLGRQSLFTGPLTGLFDGINIKLKYSEFKLTGFYGGIVPAYQKLKLADDFGNNFIAGGKLSYNFSREIYADLGFVNKNIKRDSYYTERLDENFDPIKILIQNKSNKFSYIYGDFSFRKDKVLFTNINYNYDLNFNTTSRIEIQGKYTHIENLGISFYYNYRAPQIRYNSIFAVFDFANTHEIEGGLDYHISDGLTVFGKFGDVIYKDDNSQRFTLGLNSSYGSLSYRKTLGYAGELDAVSAYTARSFFDGLITPSIGVSYTSYKLSKDSDTNTLFSLLAGANYRPLRQLSFDVQGQFFNNKIYNNDYRILFRLNYWFNANF